MPLYEYRCQKCAGVFEFIQKFSDRPKTKCEACGGKLEKLLSASGFVLKGSGWYKSDYGGSPKKSGGADAAESSTKGETKAEPAKAAEKKPKAASSED